MLGGPFVQLSKNQKVIGIRFWKVGTVPVCHFVRFDIGRLKIYPSCNVLARGQLMIRYKEK